jgi:hypothetical protein
MILPVIGRELTNEFIRCKRKVTCDTTFVAYVMRDLEHLDDGGRNQFRNYRN